MAEASSSEAPMPAPAPAMVPPDDDEELIMRRRARRRKTTVLAVVLASGYYGFAILYYTQRAMKRCASVRNAGVSNCSDPCTESWNAADAVYFATVTMTTVGYGDLRPLTSENQVVTVLFLLFGFIVRLCRAGPAAHAIARAVRLAVHRCCSCSRLHRCTLRLSRWGPAC